MTQPDLLTPLVGPRQWQRAVKRAVDMVLGLMALVLLLPVMALVAVAVALDSAGPVVYGATRIGRGGRPFTMWKFRSMASGADAVGPSVTGAYDFRITRVGAVLRRTKLDELPQLVNVLVGQMSLVGPRPESPTYVARWTEEERQVLAIRPGVTGPAQITYLDREEAFTGDPDDAYERELMHLKLALDLEYARNYSIRQDFTILWKTILSVLSAGERRTNRPRRRYTLGERLRSARAWPMLLDGALAAGAAILAVGLRIDRTNVIAAAADYWPFIPLAAVVRPATFLLAGAYLRVWRYPTVADGALVLWSLAAGTIVMTFVIFVLMQPSAFPGTVGFPRSAIIIEFLISVLVLGGIRFASRIRQEGFEGIEAPAQAGPPRPVLIYGAGEAAAVLIREMRRNRALRLEPVALIDDDRAKRGQQVYGVEVVGGGQDLVRAIDDRNVSEVIVAMPRITGDRLRRVVAMCEAANVPVRTLPAVDELLDETVTVNKIRSVRVEDLLRREPIEIDDAPTRSLVASRTVLVTGAGGSIGSELCRQLAALGAGRIVLVERAETPLFFIFEELRRRFPAVAVVPILADVADEVRLRRMFEEIEPNVVLHAAAHKHVPLSESNAAATVWTNVRGTRLVARASADIDVEAFINISTDKAVDPASVMGATKRIGENLTSEIGASARGRFVIVRFGNVLGSQGSVLDLFRQQIADGGPVTVTHPEMTRYFMTIPEAVRLILHAGAVGRSGDIHVLNMGQPIRIVDLARDLIRLSTPHGAKDIGIRFTGLRAGERLHESLFADDEQAVDTDHRFILVARSRVPDADDRRSAVDVALQLESLASNGLEQEVRASLMGAERVAEA